MATPLRTIRVDDLTWAEWVAAAKAAGLDVSSFVRQTVNDRVAGGTLSPIDSLANVEGKGPGLPPGTATAPMPVGAVMHVSVSGSGAVSATRGGNVNPAALDREALAKLRPDAPVEDAVKALQQVEVAVDGKPVKGGAVRMKGPRKVPCLHRVPADSFCSRGCD